MTFKEFLGKVADYAKKVYAYLASDGIQHLAVSALIVVTLGWIHPVAVPAAIALTVGIAKELYDHFVKGSHDHLHDIICDVIGVALGCLIVFINSL